MLKKPKDILIELLIGFMYAGFFIFVVYLLFFCEEVLR